MKYQTIFGVAGFASVFFFLPSLAIKLWNCLIYASWEAKRFLVYTIAGLLLIIFARHRWKTRGTIQNSDNEGQPLQLAKQRLAAGEISLEEFRQIKQELLQ